jgi:phosphoenolpyruvate synthase/pyruvate phosphate dikinase
MAHAGVRAEVTALHRRAIFAVDDPAALVDLCGRAAAAVRRARLPAELTAQICVAYAALPDRGEQGGVVAVRSSAVREDGGTPPSPG